MNIKDRLKALERSVMAGARAPEIWMQDDHDPTLFHLCGGTLTLSRVEVEARHASIFWMTHSITGIRKGQVLAHVAMSFDEL